MIRNTQTNKLISSDEWFAVLMMIVASGSAYFYMYNAGLTILLFILSGIILLLKHKPTIHISVFVVVYSCLIVIRFFGQGPNPGLIGDSIFLLLTFLILGSITYVRFKEILLNVTLFLCVVSILFQLVYFSHLITPTLYGAGQNGLHGHYFIFFHVFGNGQWGMGSRLAGIFWEPGIYQIILNTCLIFNLELLDSRSNIKKRKTKLGILISSIILTFSTTAYLVLGVIIIGYCIKQSVNSVKFKLLTIFASIIFALVVMMTSVVAEKFDSSNSSFLVRTNDLIGLFRCVVETPLLGTGINTHAFENLANKNGLTGSMSAGILLQTVQFGILWLISFYVSAIKEFRKRKYKLPNYVYIIVLTCFGLSEPLAFSPIMLLNVLPFKKYR